MKTIFQILFFLLISSTAFGQVYTQTVRGIILDSETKMPLIGANVILLDNEMVGDTLNIFIETIFNTEGGVTYHGQTTPVPQEIIEEQIKVIVI